MTLIGVIGDAVLIPTMEAADTNCKPGVRSFECIFATEFSFFEMKAGWIENMIGLILWSDSLDREAVIWCEDQKELAYYRDDQNNQPEGAFLEVGDFVQFELDTGSKGRRAKSVTRIQHTAGTGLADQLMNFKDPQTHHIASQTAEVVPFKPLTENTPERRRLLRRKAQAS